MSKTVKVARSCLKRYNRGRRVFLSDRVQRGSIFDSPPFWNAARMQYQPPRHTSRPPPELVTTPCSRTRYTFICEHTSRWLWCIPRVGCQREGDLHKAYPGRPSRPATNKVGGELRRISGIDSPSLAISVVYSPKQKSASRTLAVESIPGYWRRLGVGEQGRQSQGQFTYRGGISYGRYRRSCKSAIRIDPAPTSVTKVGDGKGW